MPRATHEKVRRLMEQGVTDRFEVAKRLGIHPEYARTLLNDPSEEGAIRRQKAKRPSQPADAVRCEICGERYTVIGTDVRVHGLDLAAYRERFPDAPTVAPSFQAGGVDHHRGDPGVGTSHRPAPGRQGLASSRVPQRLDDR